MNRRTPRMNLFQRCTQDTQVPVSKPFSYEDMMKQQNSLQVPNGEEVPMGSEYLMGNGIRGQYFECSDGTILSLKDGRVIRSSNDNGRNSSYWGCRMMRNPYEDCGIRDWDDREINSFENECEVGFGKNDIEYNKYSEMKNAELRQNMSDEQRELLRQVEDGQFMRKSKLIEESKNHANQ